MTNGSTSRRGYGTKHQRERQKWARLVNAGNEHCVRCGGPILPGQKWDLDHAAGEAAASFAAVVTRPPQPSIAWAMALEALENQPEPVELVGWL